MRLLWGRWAKDDAAYADGRHPTAWIGTADIIEAYRRSGRVKYAQCWVFANVFVTRESTDFWNELLAVPPSTGTGPNRRFTMRVEPNRVRTCPVMARTGSEAKTLVFFKIHPFKAYAILVCFFPLSIVKVKI